MTDLDDLLAAWCADIESVPFPDITAPASA